MNIPDSNGQSGVGCGDDTTATCCAQFYEQDLVQELMGGSYHPGGENLSRNLVEKLGLSTGSTVLDIACGVGTTSRMMANEFGLNVTGLDYSSINVGKAKALFENEKISQGLPEIDSGLTATVLNNLPVADDARRDEPCCGPGESCCPEPKHTLGAAGKKAQPGTARFVQAAADNLPFDDQTFDALTCECAVSTFADQVKVASEFWRVLKPGGIFGMTDMVVNGDLPADYYESVAPWTCMAKALTAKGYQQLFTQHGFEVVEFQDVSHTLIELATDMKRKLVMAGMGKAMGALPSMSESMGMSLPEMRKLLSASTQLVRQGTIQYGVLIFRVSGKATGG